MTLERDFARGERVALTVGAGERFSSPDGKVQCAFEMRDGHSSVDVVYGGKDFGRMTFEPGMADRYEIIATTTRTVRSSWRPVWGTLLRWQFGASASSAR